MRFAFVILAMLLAFGSIDPGTARGQTLAFEVGQSDLAELGQDCPDECSADCPEFAHCKIVCGAATLPPATAENMTFAVQQHSSTADRPIGAHDGKPQPPPPRCGFW